MNTIASIMLALVVALGSGAGAVVLASSFTIITTSHD